jgi:ABC-type multidrug transport system fused ATPase/permease subunit
LRIQALLTALIFDHALRVRVVAAPPESPSDSSNQAQHAGLSGLIADLATTDLNNVLGGNQFLLVVLDVPLETALGLGFLYYLLGWAAFAGLGVMLVLLPVPAWLATRMAAAQGRKMRATDARVSAINEAVQVLRMLKLSAYEKAVRKDIADKREEELREEWRLKLVDAINNIVSFAIPLAHLLVSFAVFVSLLCMYGALLFLTKYRHWS